MTWARLSALAGAVAVVSLGCNSKDTGESGPTGPVTTDTLTEIVDADGDGITPGDGDCDDDNPSVRPGMVESCNGVDDNCNGFTDDEDPTLEGASRHN